MPRYPGGLIRKTPVTPAGPLQNGAASGVWSLADAAYWTKQGLWPIAGNFLVVEDVFSTWLYTGNGSTQTITNGINLSGQGGLVWVKSRSAATNHFLFDTTRGVNVEINSNTTDANATLANSVTAFNSNGFTVGSAAGIGVNAATYASWTFREAPKFFDVVTYTGTGSFFRDLSHSLGVAPGFIVVKRTDTTSNWWTYHRGVLGSINGYLNLTDAFNNIGYVDPSPTPAATFRVFNAGAGDDLNVNGATYVAYLYAHDTSANGLIQCGSYVGSSSSGVTVNLGWEPQWVMIKNITQTGPNWTILDVMRGMAQTSTLYLSPNTSGAESANQGGGVNPTATGFTISSAFGNPVNGDGQTHVYIAIRRGPMKTPTLGTSVFTPILRTGTGSSATITTSFAPDFVLTKATTGTYATYWWNAVDRLRGALQGIFTNATTAETAVANGLTTLSSGSFSVGTDFNYNDINTTYINYTFGRAPNFFDEVCYTGTGVLGRTVAHNLGVAPEMIIVKRRSAASDWGVYHSALGNTKLIYLNYNLTPYTAINWWNNTTPTASVFTVGDQNENNASGSTYVSYLFASCPGVSKVGSYTGTGALQTINCAFTTGARFVLIKRTDSTGDWFVWDSARGISSGSDPYSVLNDPAGQVTGTNYVDTTATGFQVTAAAPAGINANGGTYIFLAIA